MLKFFAEIMWVLYIESTKTVNEMTLNELVKLLTLWTTGPWCWEADVDQIVSVPEFTYLR